MTSKNVQRNADHRKAIEQVIKQVCQQYLDQGYLRVAVLVLQRLAALEHLSLGGKAGGWAGGILWALFEHNFYHAAPEPVGTMLSEVLAVNVNTIRNRRNQVEAALGMGNPHGAADYMHPEVYEMLDKITQPDRSHMPSETGLEAITMQLALPPLAPEAQQALIEAFQAKLDRLMQDGDLDLPQMKALAAEFGITVVDADQDDSMIDPLFDVQSQRPS